MKWLLMALFSLNVTWARESLVIPAFLEAAKVYVELEGDPGEAAYLRPEIRGVVKILQNQHIDPTLMKSYIEAYPEETKWLLPSDKYDVWIERSLNQVRSRKNIPEVSLHAYKLSVIRPSDSWFKDDLYAYYFVTEGVVPVGKVTSMYKGIGSGQSIFFNEKDRVLFPHGIPSKSPENHLIVDYGLIESDGDDIRELQKLTSIIIDIAISVYTNYDSRNGQILANLRKEIKALADLLLSLNKDDRLVTGSFGFEADKLNQEFNGRSWIEFKKNHRSGESLAKKWEYDFYFRLLRK